MNKVFAGILMTIALSGCCGMYTNCNQPSNCDRGATCGCGCDCNGMSNCGCCKKVTY